MADTKLTALTETTSPALTDDVYVVTTPGGTPASKRATIANLKAAMSVGMTKITTLGSGASFDFTSIPGTYTELKIIGTARGDTAAAGIGVHILFNNDSAGNYDGQFGDANAAAVSALESLATAQNYAAGIPAASAAAGLAGTFEITIPNYTGTTFNKRWHCLTGQSQAQASAGHHARITAGQWRNTAAVTRVTLICTTGNFAAGSTATLYGIG